MSVLGNATCSLCKTRYEYKNWRDNDVTGVDAVKMRLGILRIYLRETDIRN